MGVNKIFALVILLLAGISCSDQQAKEKSKTANGVPTVYLMPWFSTTKEGASFGELRLYQTEPEVSGLKVQLKISGTPEAIL